MTIKNDFIAEVKKVNSHFERFFKSSLRPVIRILEHAVPGPGHIIFSTQDLDNLAATIAGLKPSKKKKYRAALEWLGSRVVGLETALSGTSIAIGQTAMTGYMPGKEVRRKDKDGNWHKFYLQQKGNSCGPTCVRAMMLAHTLNPLPSEGDIRNMMSLVEDDEQNKGIDFTAHDWETHGSRENSIVSILKSYGLRSARTVIGHENIRKALAACSKNEPAIVGWWWGPSYGIHDTHWTGHWTTCVGSTDNGSEFILLDPWTEIEYISAAQYWQYLPSGGGYGWFDPNDPSAAVIVAQGR